METPPFTVNPEEILFDQWRLTNDLIQPANNETIPIDQQITSINEPEKIDEISSQSSKLVIS